MQLKDVGGIILIGIILFFASMVENPDNGRMLLSKMFEGIKDFVKWLNRQ